MLNSTSTTELRVLGTIDLSHAPRAELFDDAVVRYGPTDHNEAIVALSAR